MLPDNFVSLSLAFFSENSEKNFNRIENHIKIGDGAVEDKIVDCDGDLEDQRVDGKGDVKGESLKTHHSEFVPSRFSENFSTERQPSKFQR